jgi:SAM-dependent methyltransferase
VSPVATRKTYDRAYFERWYRDPRYAVIQRDLLARRVQLAIAAAEYVLERPVRNVLDIGCGEAPWRALIKQARPRARYVGIDSSEYVVKRFGKSRNIRLGRFGELGSLGLKGPFDLIVCSDVLHYVGRDEVKRGLGAVARLLGGLAFIEVFTDQDNTVGDDHDYQLRSPAQYRRMFREAGLVPMGLHCYVGRTLSFELMALEKGVG